ncbi:MAG: hypothetical protein J6T38_11475 [Bacteroidaceae bacterium]|nr:hypothetical protein [Bacteroidaceae bacterium]
MTPETEVYNIQVEATLQTGSVLESTDWTSGGTASSRPIEDDEPDFLIDTTNSFGLGNMLLP